MKIFLRILQWAFVSTITIVGLFLLMTGVLPVASLIGGAAMVVILMIEGVIHGKLERLNDPGFKFEYPTPSQDTVIDALMQDLEVTEFWYKAVIKQLEEDVSRWKIIADTNSIFGVSASERERQLAVMLQDARDMVAELMPKGDERDDEYLGYIDEKLAVYKYVKQIEEERRLSDAK